MMTSQPGYQRGDRIALVRTGDPHTRLRPGDQGTVTRWNPAQDQLSVAWDSGSALIMLPGEGDQVRLLARAASEDGTEPEDRGDPDDGEPAPDRRQDITDRATGLSRLLSERCATCILLSGDPMHLGPERTAAFIRHALDAGSYVVCHETLTYGDFPDYGPAICRGFFDAYRDRTRDLLILRAARRLTEIPPPLAAKAEQLGRDAGKTGASRVSGGNTPRRHATLGAAARKELRLEAARPARRRLVPGVEGETEDGTETENCDGPLTGGRTYPTLPPG